MGKSSSFYAGVDLGATKMRAILVNEDFDILAIDKKSAKGEGGVEAGMERIAASIDTVLDKASVSKKRLAGIGFGLPGVLDIGKGHIVKLTNFDWADVPTARSSQNASAAP